MCNVTSVAVAVFITFWMFENIKALLIMFFFMLMTFTVPGMNIP